MMKRSAILIALSVFVVASLFFFVFLTIKNRYFDEKNSSPVGAPLNNLEQKEDNTENNLDANDIQKNDNGELDSENNEENSRAENENKVSGDIFTEITQKDCDNECRNFKDKDDQKYCRQVCGLDETRVVSEDCLVFQGLEKDYCFKDLALVKKDFKFCEKISDKNIQTTCNNRLIEEVLNNR